MSEIENILSEDDVNYILKPILKNFKELTSFDFLDRLERLDAKDQAEILDSYSKEVPKVYQMLPKLIGLKEIIENFTKNERLEQANERIQKLVKKLQALIDSNILVKIQLQDPKLQLSPDFKLLLTPLGLFFIYCHYTTLGPSRMNIKDLMLEANSKMGQAFNLYSIDRINFFLNQSKAPFSKKEIVISLLLLMSQATSPNRTIIIEKSSDNYLYEALSYIANAIFGENLFLKIGDVYDSIRRSTNVGSLDGKTQMLFVREESKDKTGSRLYFNFSEKNKSEELSFLIAKVLQGLKSSSEADNKSYIKSALQLVDQHINNRNTIFGLKPYVREKLLSQPEISTAYLENFYSEIKKHLT